MAYEGVKYKTIHTSFELPRDERIDELRRWCRVFDRHGLAPAYPGGTHGNMSFRLKPGHPEIVITAARSSFAETLADDSFFAIQDVDFSELKVYTQGDKNREPSSETMLHFAVYQARPDVQAILHGHCKPITENADKMGIVVTKKFVESGTLLIIKSVLEVLENNNFLEIRDHGFLSMGNSVNEAGELAMEMLKKVF